MWGKDIDLRPDPPGTPKAEETAVVPAEQYLPPKKPWERDKEMRRVIALEDRLYEKNLALLEAGTVGATNYDDDEDRQQVSPDEIKEHGGIKEALRYKRVAMDSRRSKKHAPVYLENAKAIVSSISRTRAAEQKRGGEGGGGPVVNVFINKQTINNGKTYEEVEVTEDDEQ